MDNDSVGRAQAPKQIEQFFGQKTMKTKPKPKKVVIPSSDREEHELLREALSIYEPRLYGDLRRELNLAPHRLEYELFTYPEIFEARESDDGRPMIRLREGKLPSREEILMKRQLIKTVRAAGSNGIYLRTLYSNLGYKSKLVERILAGVPEVEAALEKNKKTILYRWTAKQDSERFEEPEKSRIHDMSSQKSPTAFEDPAPRLAVQPALPKPAAPIEEPLMPASMPQAQEFSDAEYAELKFRPGAPGMALRRGGASITKAGHRPRHDPPGLSSSLSTPPPSRVGGRKRQMTDRKVLTARKLLASGTPPHEVAHNLGVSVPALYRWYRPLHGRTWSRLTKGTKQDFVS